MKKRTYEEGFVAGFSHSAEVIAKLERQIKIKDAWCQMIRDIGFDYDGYEDVKNLKDVIDELVDFSNKAIESDDKTAVYFHHDFNENLIKENILEEPLKGSDK